MKVLRKQEIDTANIQVGDQMVIPLAELGEFKDTQSIKVTTTHNEESVTKTYGLSGLTLETE